MVQNHQFKQWDIVAVRVEKVDGDAETRYAVIISSEAFHLLNRGLIANPIIHADDGTPEHQDVEIAGNKQMTRPSPHFVRPREFIPLKEENISDRIGQLGRGERAKVRKLLKSYFNL